VSIGRIVSYDDARRLARSNQWREKVLVYVTRGEELLVLEHTADYPDAGIQVPAGGVDPGESPEEAGRGRDQRTVRRDRPYRPNATHLPAVLLVAQLRGSVGIRHYYWVEALPETPTTWPHVVSAGEGDEGMTFLLSFRPPHPDRPHPGIRLGRRTATPLSHHESALTDWTRGKTSGGSHASRRTVLLRRHPVLQDRRHAASLCARMLGVARLGEAWQRQ
jgi:8-oxo-dGTP diphosphatase